MSDRACDLARQLAAGAQVEPPDDLTHAELDALAERIDELRATVQGIRDRLPSMSADEKRQALADLKGLMAQWQGQG